MLSSRVTVVYGVAHCAADLAGVDVVFIPIHVTVAEVQGCAALLAAVRVVEVTTVVDAIGAVVGFTTAQAAVPAFVCAVETLLRSVTFVGQHDRQHNDDDDNTDNDSDDRSHE